MNGSYVVVSGQAAFMAYRWKPALHSGDERTAANDSLSLLPELLECCGKLSFAQPKNNRKVMMLSLPIGQAQANPSCVAIFVICNGHSSIELLN